MADIEMKDASKEEKKTEVPVEQEPSDQFYELKKNLVLLERAAKDKDHKMVATLTKQFKKLRHVLTLGDTILAFSHYLPDLWERLQLPCQPSALKSGCADVQEMLHCTHLRASEITEHAEAQLFLYVILQMKLIDDGDYQNAKDFSDFVYARVANSNSRLMDHIFAKAFYFMAVAYEKVGQLTSLEFRPKMFNAYKECCLHHNTIGQATIMNIIIRSYLAQNLYEQAHNFITKTTFPPNCTNNQYARYLYYVGRIKSVQMEYSESQSHLIQAQRKSPEVGALGFRIQTQKILILVELLMGDIPNRQIFNQPEYQVPLAPYFAVVSCAKSGDMGQFKKLMEKYRNVFIADNNLTLVQRLRHTVIKFGLKKINISYSKISLEDIRVKLMLGSVEETEHIVAKAIRDGVIDATINHDLQFIQSSALTDVYQSNDPQFILDKRIKFCMSLHQDAVKALVYPPKEDLRDFPDFEEAKAEQDLASLFQEFLDDY